MVTVNLDRSATLIARVWLEDGPAGFRARLTSADTSPGSEGDELTVAVASSAGDMVDAVRAWLDEFMGQTDPPGHSGRSR